VGSRRETLAVSLLLLAAGAATPSHAVPPLVLGDVPTADKGHAEIYLGFLQEEGKGGIERGRPANELVLGVSSWQEVTVELPYRTLNPSQGDRQSGVGDAVLGTKMMFLRETENRPGAALSFETKLDNADAAKGLGSGAVDYGLLLRAQKTHGWFTAIGNVGYTFVGEPVIDRLRQDKRNVLFLAFAQEYRVAAKTSLLSEVYWKNSDTPGGPSRFAGDIGFKHDLRSWLQVHTTVGKSLREGNLGGPKLRVYAGFKLEFSVFPEGERSHDQKN